MSNQYEDAELVDDDWVSKSQLKRESVELQKLGRDLADLSVEKIESAGFSGELQSALLLAKQSKKGAHKRQIKYIGKLLRSMDCQPMIDYLDRANNASAEAVRELHQAEQWRDRFLEEGDAALSDFLKQFSGADRQSLRQMIRSAQQEAKLQKPPKTARILFRYLRELVSS
ncbi:MAG: ribosome-associated protein [Gammaproteobacteria bacterium]|nr:MAG: ribosome-associated protein [Gammaproteobacteria bacterium]RLA23880.1 MAG: ribosome-associated protein [Gammaproteobacteria bacterium]